ncbi:MAG: M20/M25/M40 family metallo-hydrolase [Clostridia bacterium]|nr:M20/M25/M40 family metallo-hydrolase [Clostridia bacterium]
MWDYRAIKEGVQEIFEDLMTFKSDTGTIKELDIEQYLHTWICNQKYFQKNPDKFGMYHIDDNHGRKVIWGLVKGEGDDTVILMHHHDVVDSFDYGNLIGFSNKPEQLKEKLKELSLDEAIERDLEGDEWIFGRGSCDMKAGAAIQMYLLQRYSEMEEFNGNVMLLSVPDEESISIGMRKSVGLLVDLKKKFNLNYRIMIDSEPHAREEESVGEIFEGSVGKIMPVIFVKGQKAHVGDIFQGLNPVPIMAEIIRKIDMNPEFSDIVENEMSPPPSFTYMKDNKIRYDASVPDSVSGYFNVLPLTSTPQMILEKIEAFCNEAFEEALEKVNYAYSKYSETTLCGLGELRWTKKVMKFSSLIGEVTAHDPSFMAKFDNKKMEIYPLIVRGEMSFPEATLEIIKFTVEHYHDKTPIVVIGISPPYYPQVSNRSMVALDEKLKTLSEHLDGYSRKNFHVEMRKKNFFMGISDMSYTSKGNVKEIIESVSPNMPLWDKEVYSIPFEEMNELDIPVINIGPWGKDLHQFTERVYAEDCLYRTPMLIKESIDYLLNIEYPVIRSRVYL